MGDPDSSGASQFFVVGAGDKDLIAGELDVLCNAVTIDVTQVEVVGKKRLSVRATMRGSILFYPTAISCLQTPRNLQKINILVMHPRSIADAIRHKAQSLV